MDKLEGYLHALYRIDFMIFAIGVENKVVRKGPGFDFVFFHFHDPWSHEERNHVHGKWASLRDGGDITVRFTERFANLESDV